MSNRKPDRVFKKDEIEQKSNIAYVNHLEIFCADDIEPQQQQWLWPGIIPLDHCTLLAGMGGVGKSMLLAEIASRVTRGEKFNACGTEHSIEQGRVIILAAEDSFSTNLRPRLDASGADLKLVHFAKSVVNTNDSSKRRLIALDEDLHIIEQAIKKFDDVKFLIIDPVMYFLGKVKDHDSTQVCNYINNLGYLSEKYHLATLLNKHLRKKDSGASITTAVDEVAGAGAWVNAPRIGWVVTRDHDDEDKVLISNIKSNLTKKKNQALAYRINQTHIQDKQGNKIEASYLVWENELVNINPDEAMNKEIYAKGKEQQAIDFIEKYLKENGKTVLKTLKDYCAKAKFKSRTIDRAIEYWSKSGKIIITDGIGKNKSWIWRNE